MCKKEYYFLRCSRANYFPWCSRCMQNIDVFKRIFLRRNQNHRKQQNLRRICHKCVNPVKSFDIEAISCENFSCQILQNLVRIEKENLNEALNSHLLSEKPLTIIDLT